MGSSLKAARRNSWLAAVSLVVVYLAGVGHVVFVPHVLCEHGELSHARPLDPASLAERVFESPVSTIASAARLVGLTSPEGHQHCLVCTNRRNQLSRSHGGFAPCRTVIGLREPQSDGISAVCLAVLQFAPKQSPPA
jgi:hypothetical protein